MECIWKIRVSAYCRWPSFHPSSAIPILSLLKCNLHWSFEQLILQWLLWKDPFFGLLCRYSDQMRRFRPPNCPLIERIWGIDLPILRWFFFIDQLLGYLRILKNLINLYEFLFLSTIKRFSHFEIIVLLQSPAVSELFQYFVSDSWTTFLESNLNGITF